MAVGLQAITTQHRELDLRAVRVRPTRGHAEHRLWDRLCAKHHYLPFHGLFGRALRQVATLDGEWLALLGWQAGALRVRVRDRWIGWSLEQKLRRLHLVGQNARFVVLPAAGGCKNLASRALGLSLRRLSADMQDAHGHGGVLLAETFLDPSRFAGTCYRAANWRLLGLTSGYRRRPGPKARWEHHGRPKQVLVYPLQRNARALLSQPGEQPQWQGPPKRAPAPVRRLRELARRLQGVAECRQPQGKRYPLASLLCLAASAHVAGYRGVTAFAQYAALLSQRQLAAAGCFYDRKLGRHTAPVPSTFHKVLAKLPPETFEEALAQACELQRAGRSGQAGADGAGVGVEPQGGLSRHG